MKLSEEEKNRRKAMEQATLDQVVLRSHEDPLKRFEGRQLTAKEEVIKKQVEKRLAERQPIIEDFHRSGFEIIAFTDLRYFKRYHDDPKIVPILMKWIPIVKDEINKEGLILAAHVNKYVKNYPGFLEMILEEWEKPYEFSGVRNAIGNVISKYADDRFYDTILRYAKNQDKIDLGDESVFVPRSFFVDALGKMKKHPEAVDELIYIFQHDEWVTIFAVNALGNLKNPKALPYLQPYVSDERSWLRQAAKRAIAKIEKAQAKG